MFSFTDLLKCDFAYSATSTATRFTNDLDGSNPISLAIETASTLSSGDGEGMVSLSNLAEYKKTCQTINCHVHCFIQSITASGQIIQIRKDNRVSDIFFEKTCGVDR